MNADLRDRICSSPQAKELAAFEIPEPSLDELRQQFGGPGLDDDELLLRYFAGADSVTAMRATSLAMDGGQPMVTLIKELMKKPNVSEIRIDRGGMALNLVGARIYPEHAE